MFKARRDRINRPTSTIPVLSPVGPAAWARLSALLIIAAGLGPGSGVVRAQTAYESAVTGDDPITWWRLGEPSGTTAFDSSTIPPANHDGTYVGGVTLGVPGLVPGEPGTTAAQFNGINSRVDIPSDPLINTGEHAARTIELWFNAGNAATATPQVLFEEGGGGNGFNLYVHNGQLVAGAWRTGGAAGEQFTQFLSTPVDSATTYQAQLVFDRLNTSGNPNLNNPNGTNSVTLFLDGKAAAQGWVPSTMLAHTGLTAIGAMRNDTRFTTGPAGGNGNHFAGVIDEVALYNSGLTTNQIQAHWAAGGNATNNALPAFNAYEQTVLADNPVAFMRVGGANEATSLTSGAGLGGDLSGILRGSVSPNTPPLPNEPCLVPLGDSPATRFTGNTSGIEYRTNTAFNQTNDRRAVSFWFQADATNDRQMLFESGGADRGLNAYLLDGQLHLHSWNTPNDGAGAPWGGGGTAARHVFTDIEPGQSYHLALSLDGNTSTTGTLTGYLDGVPFGQIGGVGRLYSHSDASGFGRVFGSTRYHDIGTSSTQASYVGLIDDPALFLGANNLNAEKIQNHYTAGTGLAPDFGPYGNAVLADNPVVYYHAGGVNVANANTSTAGVGAAADANVTAAAVPTATGTLIWDGSGGLRTMDFSANNGRIELPAISGINTNGPHPVRTFEFLFGTGSDVTTRQVLFDGGGTTNGFGAYIENSLLHLGVWADNSIISYLSTPIDPNSRYHTAGVYDSTVGGGDDFFAAYLNGMLAGMDTGNFSAIPNHTDPLALGGRVGGMRFLDGPLSGGTGHHFDGLMAGFALYNTALTPEQIFAHGAAANIPEPSRTLLLTLAAALLLGRRRR